MPLLLMMEDEYVAISQKLRDRLVAEYDDPALVEAIAADVEAHGTEKGILAGKMTLPHPKDARRWFEAKQREAAKVANDAAQKAEIDALKKQVAALTEAQAKGGQH